jgi:hypothetical protein
MIKTEKERRRVAIAQKNNPPSKSKSVANAAPLKPKPVGKGVIVNSGQNIKPSVNQAPQAVAVVKSEPKPAQPVKQDSAARIPPVPEPIKPVAADPSAMPDQEMLRRAASGDTVGIYVEERTKLDAFLAENAFGTHDDPHEFLLNTREETRNRTRAPDELESATHVITGAFISKANAEHFTSELRKLGFNANFGQLSQLKIWYVFIAKETDLVKARAERDEFRKNKIFRNAWVLTVQ